MQYEVSFGELGRPQRPAGPMAKFRLAVLGDFSGRANAGKLEVAAALGRRKAFKLDIDSLDDVLGRQKLELSLALAEDGTAIKVPIGSMDDFHPDQLAESLELFEQLLALRRNLGSRTGFDRAAKEVLSWGGEEPLPVPPRRAAGMAVATDRRLSDFARLTGRPRRRDAAEATVEDLVRRIVGPHVVPARDARQDQLTARVDEALSAAMRRILHHPDFQAAEATWRGVEMLARRIETDEQTEIVLYDVSAEEFAADLAATDVLEDSGLYSLLVEQPALDADAGPLSAVVGLYTFELTPPHADLLGRIAKIAAAARAPFLTGIAPDALAPPFHEQHRLIKEAFTALQALPAAAYLGLATPRFLLRLPYGRKTDPIDAFAFDEFTRQDGLGAMLWGHPALIPALLLAQTWAKQGGRMQPGSILAVGDMPYFVYTDVDGEQIALPCTERLYTERQAARLANYRVMPLLTMRGRPEVRLGGFGSLAGTPLAGFWGAPELKPAPAARPTPAFAPVAAPAQAEPAAPVAEPQLDVVPAVAPDRDSDGLRDAAEGVTSAGVEAPEQSAAGEDDLDALLASLNAAPPAAAPGATEPDLDALLASLK